VIPGTPLRSPGRCRQHQWRTISTLRKKKITATLDYDRPEDPNHTAISVWQALSYVSQWDMGLELCMAKAARSDLVNPAMEQTFPSRMLQGRCCLIISRRMWATPKGRMRYGYC